MDLNVSLKAAKYVIDKMQTISNFLRGFIYPNVLNVGNLIDQYNYYGIPRIVRVSRYGMITLFNPTKYFKT